MSVFVTKFVSLHITLQADKRKLLQSLEDGDEGSAPPSAPENNIETQLRDIFAAVLNVDPSKIGRDTSFFELGGDSISAIRVQAKCKQASIPITVKAVLTKQTVAELALYAANGAASNQSEDFAVVTGIAPLSPVQKWFLEHKWKSRDQFNQSWLMIPREPLRIDALHVALKQLFEHHDMLRASFKVIPVDGPDRFRQVLLSPSDPNAQPRIRHVHLKDMSELPTQVQAAQSKTLIGTPTHNVILFETPEGQRLFITVHHLLVDLVSWRIIWEDLETLLSGGTLPGKTTSFPQWIHSMTEYAESINPLLWAARLRHISRPSPFRNAVVKAVRTVDRSASKHKAAIARELWLKTKTDERYGSVLRSIRAAY